jgi:hypothetical protein
LIVCYPRWMMLLFAARFLLLQQWWHLKTRMRTTAALFFMQCCHPQTQFWGRNVWWCCHTEKDKYKYIYTADTYLKKNNWRQNLFIYLLPDHGWKTHLISTRRFWYILYQLNTFLKAT